MLVLPVVAAVPLLGASAKLAGPVLLLGGAALLGVAGGGWFLLGRRQRAYQRAQQLVQEKDWPEALIVVRQQQNRGGLSPMWEGRFRNLEGECHRQAGEFALVEHRFEDALEHHRSAARLLGSTETEARARVVEAMLAEARRLFATTTGRDTEAVQQVLARVVLVESPCFEASFWQGLCYLRMEQNDRALTALQAAREPAAVPLEGRFLDPLLYLGALLLREGRPQEALRYLSEANRLAPGCPFVTWQLGMALVAAKGDSALAVRALQRALGSQGLSRWIRTPNRAWVDGLPEGRSYVQRLASASPFTCPLMGGSVVHMIRQGQRALGQAQLRLGNNQEAANLFAGLLHDCPPTALLSRGLGQALARLERYEEAFKHLRFAYDQEDPKDPCTTGYLALCGARGKPTQPDDKLKNVTWALRLLASFDLRGDAEWASLCSTVQAEARALGVPIPVEDQVRLCNALAFVEATDPSAAAAYEHLAVTAPVAVRPEQAWLYCRAVQQHGCAGPHAPDLFAAAFRDPPAFRAFAAARQWNFEDLEYAFLEQTARKPLVPALGDRGWAEGERGDTGDFPEVLGAEYPARGEALLLARSRRLEEARQSDAALAAAEVLAKLAPQNPRALERLAYLCHRRGDLDRAAELLGHLHQLVPAPLTLLRRAVVEQQRGHWAGCADAIAQALAQIRGRGRALVAFLGARLALASGAQQPPHLAKPLLGQAAGWLHTCLEQDPEHADALWLLAAVRVLQRDDDGLAAQAAAMQRPDVAGARFHYLAAVCHLAAAEYPQVHEAATRAALDPGLAAESAYLHGWAFWLEHDLPAARAALEVSTHTPDSLSADHAHALLGRIHFTEQCYDDAIAEWTALDPEKRAAWTVDEALRGTAFLSALQAFREHRFERAAERLREAGRLGCRDRRLGSLLVLALVKAGQQLLFTPHQGSHTPRSAEERAASLLEQAINAGCRDPQAAELLALAYQRQGKFREARDALLRIAEGDALVHLRRGLLALEDNQFAQAEQDFAQALEREPGLYEACYNLLLTRLSLGQIDAAVELLPRAQELAQLVDDRRLFAHLHALLRRTQAANGTPDVLQDMTPDEEERLIELVSSLGQLDLVWDLLRLLSAARPQSRTARQAHCEATLVRAAGLLERCDWAGAKRLLLPLADDVPATRPTQAAVYNLLGCCACLSQDFEEGTEFFQAALRRGGNDPRVQQNLALSHEWRGRLGEAEPHWNLYFDRLDRRVPAAPDRPDYQVMLAYEGLYRLANKHVDKEEWNYALAYAQRAQRLKPDDPVALERLLQLFNQAGRIDDARGLLRRLSQLRPNDPRIDLYELDLIKVRNLEDIERMLGGVEGLLSRYPNEPTVESRATTMVGGVIPLMGRLADQLTEQMGKITHQIRHLPEYQINWTAVRDVMRDLRTEFSKLRQITGRCLPLVRDEDQRRTIRELNEQIDRKFEHCQTLME